MPYTAIHGTFHIVNYSPDGDSIRFRAADPQRWKDISGSVKVNAKGHAQLRLEGIDALETHYTPPAPATGVYHQPPQLAFAAVDRLLGFTGITQVQWDSSHRTVVAAQDGTPGYILSRAADKYQRPIAFLFAGVPPDQDGASVQLTPQLLEGSYNHTILGEGLAYPTYYSQLFADLRNSLSEAVAAARTANLGLWAIDQTNAGVDVTSLSVLMEDAAILPKLFRRLVEYIATTGSAEGFKAALELSREPVLDLRDNNFTHFDTFVAQDTPTRIALTRRPEELVFDPMPQRAPDHFARVAALVETLGSTGHPNPGFGAWG